MKTAAGTDTLASSPERCPKPTYRPHPSSAPSVVLLKACCLPDCLPLDHAPSK
jgi:hypothetical protein